MCRHPPPPSLTLCQGKIVERGTHAELLRIPIVKDAATGKMASGWYSDLWKTQMGEKEGGGGGGGGGDGDGEAAAKAAKAAKAAQAAQAAAEAEMTAKEAEAAAKEAEAAARADVTRLAAENDALKQQIEEMARSREEADMSSAATTPKGATPPTSPSVARATSSKEASLTASPAPSPVARKPDGQKALWPREETSCQNQ